MKHAIYINGNRNGYIPAQTGRTLTAGELIAALEQFDEDRPIYLRNDNGYTYGSITERDISASEDIDDEDEEEEEE